MIETMIRAFFAMLEFHSVDVVILIRHDVYRISRDDADVDAPYQNKMVGIFFVICVKCELWNSKIMVYIWFLNHDF